MTKLHATYHPDFEHQDFVQHIVDAWYSGQDHFTLKTSGSTGHPKDIALPRKLLVWSAENTRAALALQQPYIYCCLPVQKTGGFMQIIRALHFGWRIHFAPPSEAPLNELGEHNYTFTSLTPMQAANCSTQSLAQFSHILIGGAAISPSVEEKLNNLPHTLCYETYGMTETASHIALRAIDKASYFTPQKGVRLSATNDQLCIAIDALGMSLQTEDLVAFHGKQFEIKGRADQAINTGGIKVFPKDIEPMVRHKMEELNDIQPFYITHKKDDVLGQKVVLILEGTPLPKHTLLLQNIQKYAPKYHAPKEIIYVPTITYTDTGKIVRETF